MVLEYMGEVTPDDGPEWVYDGSDKVLKIECDAHCQCQEKSGVEDTVETFLAGARGADAAGSIPGGGT